MLVVRTDGLVSWLVLFCVFLGMVMLGGVCLNGGLFFIMFGDAFNSGTVETSWLCSLPITMWFLGSPIGSLLTNRYDYRTSAFIGGLIAATGISIGYFASHIAFLFVSHGFLTGLGFGINYTACMSALNVYFDKYKTAALGLASIGHNLGQVIFASLLVTLQQYYGWRGTMLIVGALTFNLCAFAAFMMHVPSKRNDGSSQKVTKKYIKDTEYIAVSESEKDESTLVRKETRAIFNFSVLRKLSFLCFCASNVFVNTGQGVYILHLPSYSRDAGFREKDFSLLWLVYGTSNIIGKVVYSCVGQHPKVNTTALYTVSLTLTGVFIGLTPVFLNKTGVFLTAGCVGFFYCVTGALIQAVIFDIVGYDRFPDGIGMAMPFKATGNLIGGPLAGILLTTTGSYTSSFYLAGVTMMIGSMFMIYPIIHKRRRDATSALGDTLTVSEEDVPFTNVLETRSIALKNWKTKSSDCDNFQSSETSLQIFSAHM